jgi:hypothetical protein
MAPEPPYSISSETSCSICYEYIDGGFICKCLKYVCDNCKREMESHNITQCPHCRQSLSIYKTYITQTYYRNIIGLFFLFICKIIVQVWYPLYLMKTADIAATLIITLSPVILEPYTILYICVFDNYIHIKFFVVNIILLLYNLVTLTLVRFTDYNTINNIILYNTLIISYIPFTIIIFIQVFVKYINIHTLLLNTIKTHITIGPVVISEMMI